MPMTAVATMRGGRHILKWPAMPVKAPRPHRRIGAYACIDYDAPSRDECTEHSGNFNLLAIGSSSRMSGMNFVEVQCWCPLLVFIMAMM